MSKGTKILTAIPTFDIVVIPRGGMFARRMRMEVEISNTRHKHREGKEYKDLINRLNRMEGQIRGVKRMLEEECYCVDILTQVSAIQAALNGFNKALLSNHIKTCVVDDIKQGKEDVVDELLKTLQKIMK